MRPSKLWPPNGALTVAILSWGFNFVALKVLYQEMSAPAVALVRYFAMVAVLVGFCLVTGRSLKYPPSEAPRLLFMGFVSMGVYMVFFLEGMAKTTAGDGAIILATAPVMTYLIACLVRQERFVPSALFASLVAFVGVAVVILSGAKEARHGSLYGNTLVLISAVLWAVAVVLSRPFALKMDPVRLLTLSMPGALLALLPYGLGDALRTDYAAISGHAWLMFAHIAVMSGVVAFTCFYRGIQQIGPSGATTYQYFTPVCTVVFAYFVLGDAVEPGQIIGLSIVIAGVALSLRARTPKVESGSTTP